MNFIAMLVLQQLSADGSPSEEEAFWLLVHIMYQKGWRDIFNQKSDKVPRIIEAIEAHMQVTMPKLASRF